MTLAQLQAYCSDLLDDTNNGYFTLASLTMRLNLALRELQKRLISANEQWYSVCVTTPMVVDQAEYALPSDFLEIIRLSRITQGSGASSVYQKINPITPNQVDLLADSTKGDPWFYVINKATVTLHPIPQTTQLLHLNYSYSVADMVNSNDIPDAPPQYHEYIGVLATRDCYIKDGRSIAPIEQKLQEYEKLFKETAQQRKVDTARMVTRTSSWDD